MLKSMISKIPDGEDFDNWIEVIDPVTRKKLYSKFQWVRLKAHIWIMFVKLYEVIIHIGELKLSRLEFMIMNRCVYIFIIFCYFFFLSIDEKYSYEVNIS